MQYALIKTTSFFYDMMNDLFYFVYSIIK